MRISISFLIATVSARPLRSSVNATASPSLDVVVYPGYGNSTASPWYTENGNFSANTTSSPWYREYGNYSANTTASPWYTENGNYTANTTSYPGYGNIIEFPDFLGNR
jgi:hypothetical protein